MKSLKKILVGLSFVVVTLFSSATTIEVEYRIDPTYTSITNYQLITKLMNQIYAPAGIYFKCVRVSNNTHCTPTYDLIKLNTFTKGQEGDKDIVVCIVGKHEGDVAGRANLWGYFENHSRVFVDLNAVKSTQGKANMIAHEIGHLFGLEHTCDGYLMGEYTTESPVQLCDKSKKHLIKL